VRCYPINQKQTATNATQGRSDRTVQRGCASTCATDATLKCRHPGLGRHETSKPATAYVGSIPAAGVQMGQDTTTITVTTDQREQLERRKVHEREPLRDVVARLLDDAGDSAEIDDLREQLDRIERTLREGDD